MTENVQEVCCQNLLRGFKFEDLRIAQPPDRRGVYVIRVKRRGATVEEILKGIKQLVQVLNWKVVGDYILSRARRLERINQCPIIYIGAAGAQKTSRNTLRGRYEEFSGRHTIMYPVWALIYFGWELEFGWKEEDSPKDAESQLKQKYKALHGGKLPALVQR